MADKSSEIWGSGQPGAGEIMARLDHLELQLNALKRRQNPVRILEELSNDAGLLEAGEFRSGNGAEPGAGFTGGRYGYPGFTYDGVEFFIVGVESDQAQVGLSLADGTLYFGAGAGRLNAEGLLIKAATNPTAANKIRFMDGAGTLLLGEIYSDETGADPAFYLNTFYPLVISAGLKGGLNLQGNLQLSGGLVKSGAGFIGLGAPATLTIAAGVVTATRSYHLIDTQAGAASDDLTNILGGGDGDLLVLSSLDAGRDPTARDAAGGAGQLRLAGDFTFSQTTDTLMLIKRGSTWHELGRSDND